MNDPNYDEPLGSKPQGEEPSSVEGKGWDILAGGEQNAYAMGGENPFDEDPSASSPYTNDDETEWILTTGTTPEAAAAAMESSAPRDLTPEELSQFSVAEGGPVTAPSYMFPGGTQTPPEPTAGLSIGVDVTLGEEGLASSEPDPMDSPPLTENMLSMADAVIVPQDMAPTGPGSISPGVSVTPIDDQGEELDTSTMPEFTTGSDLPPPRPIPDNAPVATTYTEAPLGGSKEAPEHIDMEPLGGEIHFDQPLVTPSPYPPAPDVPPWDIPSQPGITQQGGMFAGTFSRPSDPFGSDLSPRQNLFAGPELEPDESLRKMLITEDRVNALWDEITETFELLVSDVRGHYDTTEQSIMDLKRARELLLAGTQNYDNAELLVIEVKARLRLEEKVRQWSRTRGTWLAVYLVIWLLLLSLLSLLTNQIQALALNFVPQDLVNTYLPTLFGGLGGVVGAIWVLTKHIAVKRDFDPIHTSWYVLNPFMGMAMGVVTYFVVLVSSNTFLKFADVNDTVTFTEGFISVLLYLFCIIVGFNQNVLWSLIDRIIDTIFPRPAEEQTSATDVVTGNRPVIEEPLTSSRDPKV